MTLDRLDIAFEIRILDEILLKWCRACQISIGCQVFAKGTPEPQRRLFPRSHLIQIFCHNDINVIDIPIAYPNQRCGGAKSISWTLFANKCFVWRMCR